MLLVPHSKNAVVVNPLGFTVPLRVAEVVVTFDADAVVTGSVVCTVLNTPPAWLPAYKNPVELTARARMDEFVSPVLTALHVVPLSVERKAPSVTVPTKIFPFALTAKE